MRITVASVLCGGGGPKFPRTLPGEPMIGTYLFTNEGNGFSPCSVYQHILGACDRSDIIIYIHDDLEVMEDRWLSCIEGLFFYGPAVVAVGLGGATSLGHPNLYKLPYDIRNLARGGYASNQKDAEVHGERFTGTRRVAVLDAFCMAVRTDFLREIGGWPVKHLTHHVLDLWLACEAARHGKEIWMVGCECWHHGGGTSVREEYAKASWLQGGSRESDHAIPHRWLYENYRDVLPIKVEV